MQQVTIENLDYKSDKFTVKRIWRVNLEKDILGISLEDPSNVPSKTECAILILQEFNTDNKPKSYKLSVLLIELKSELNISIRLKGKVTPIEKKFITAMNRLYLLLSLNNHFNPVKGYDQDSIYIEFRGILIYNTHNISDPNRDNQLCSIINGSSNTNNLTFRTILNPRDKIPIKCFPKLSKDSAEKRIISLEDLLI